LLDAVNLRSHAAKVISVRLNDAAARALGFPLDAGADVAGADPGELGRKLVVGGLARDERGGLFVPGLSFNVPHFPDLTYRECQRNSWHLDDHPDVQVEVDEDSTPHITYEDQTLMLRQGIVLSRIVRDLARALPDRPPTRCITGTNHTNGTFRFHQLRPGERWIGDDLDAHFEDMIIVIEDQPPVDKSDSTE
jgi:hypothetical protein